MKYVDLGKKNVTWGLIFILLISLNGCKLPFEVKVVASNYDENYEVFTQEWTKYQSYFGEKFHVTPDYLYNCLAQTNIESSKYTLEYRVAKGLIYDPVENANLSLSNADLKKIASICAPIINEVGANTTVTINYENSLYGFSFGNKEAYDDPYLNEDLFIVSKAWQYMIPTAKKAKKIPKFTSEILVNFYSDGIVYSVTPSTISGIYKKKG